MDINLRFAILTHIYDEAYSS